MSIHCKPADPNTIVTEVAAVKCEFCNNVIYSRCRHDYHACSCGNTTIDGGFDYARVGIKVGKMPEVFTQTLPKPLTLGKLYRDWNKNTNKYGWIR